MSTAPNPIAAQINDAKSFGYSDDEISDYLLKTHPDLGPKIQQAKAAGYRSGEIVSYLSTPAAPAQDKGFFQTLASDVLGAPTKFMDWATSDHPIDAALDTIRQFTAARQQQQAQAKQAYDAGMYKLAAEHALYSVPFIGPMMGATASEVQNGQPGAGYAHALEVTAPALAPVVGDALEAAPSTVAGAMQGTGDVVRGVAAKLPQVGDFAASLVGVASPQAGNLIRVGTRLARILTPAEEAIDPALKAAAIDPALEAAAQKITGKSYADLTPTDQTSIQHIVRAEANVAAQPSRAPIATAPVAPSTAPAAAGMAAAGAATEGQAATPPQTLVPGGPLRQATPPQTLVPGGPLRPPLATGPPLAAPVEPATGVESPVSRETTTSPTKEPLSPQDLAAALKAEMEKSGTFQPESPVAPDMTTEARAGAARLTRADKATTLAQTLDQGGLTAKDLEAKDLTPETLKVAAGVSQTNLPKTQAAMDKLIRDTTAEFLRIQDKKTIGIGDIMKNQ